MAMTGRPFVATSHRFTLTSNVWVLGNSNYHSQKGRRQAQHRNISIGLKKTQETRSILQRVDTSKVSEPQTALDGELVRRIDPPLHHVSSGSRKAVKQRPGNQGLHCSTAQTSVQKQIFCDVVRVLRGFGSTYISRARIGWLQVVTMERRLQTYLDMEVVVTTKVTVIRSPWR